MTQQAPPQQISVSTDLSWLNYAMQLQTEEAQIATQFLARLKDRAARTPRGPGDAASQDEQFRLGWFSGHRPGEALMIAYPADQTHVHQTVLTETETEEQVTDSAVPESTVELAELLMTINLNSDELMDPAGTPEETARQMAGEWPYFRTYDPATLTAEAQAAQDGMRPLLTAWATLVGRRVRTYTEAGDAPLDPPAPAPITLKVQVDTAGQAHIVSTDTGTAQDVGAFLTELRVWQSDLAEHWGKAALLLTITG